MLVLMMLLLADFFGVRDVSWVSHQLIDGFQRFAGRIFRANFFADSASAPRKFRAKPTEQRENHTCRGPRRPAEWKPNTNKRRATACDKALDLESGGQLTVSDSLRRH